MEFAKRKAATLALLASADTDKSPKGTVDIPIIPLLNTINKHPSYFTTSSCSGRISILSQPSSTTAKKKARGGSWLYITHELADSDAVVSLLFPTELSQNCSDLVFRFEPLIIAVECKDLCSAQSLVSMAIACGFRESGITSVSKRVIIAIRCSIRLEVPLGDTGKIMVSPGYVRYLVGVANVKMEANRKRTEGFLQALERNGFVDDLILSNGDGDSERSGGLACNGIGDDDADLERKHGLVGIPGSSLSTVQMVIDGEPVEKLFLWGHSACTLDNTLVKGVLVFGGFGGMGRHARRNDTLLLDPLCGRLKAIDPAGAPSPRLGHTASLVGECVFLIGGRADPVNILSDVWILNTAESKWRLLECSGSIFPPRHRHAAAVVGSNIYVFGGLNNETILSSFHVLDTANLHWKEILVDGEWPCARHSHSMVAYGSEIFVFGGYNGEEALGDLYSFDVQTYLWKKEKTVGRSPHGRFSHSMFVYNNYLGVIGGCPVKQHCQELSLFDLRLRMWKHVTINSVGKDLFVRSTSSVVGDDLVIIGGGASCYAFGAKFSEPMKINLLPLMSMNENDIMPIQVAVEHVIGHYNGIMENKTGVIEGPQMGKAKPLAEAHDLNPATEAPVIHDKCKMVASDWVLQIKRKYAKLGKDILKKFGWLDLGRKVYSQEDGMHICFPVTEEFCAIFHEMQNQLGDALEGQNDCFDVNSSGGVLLDEVSCSEALNLLKVCGATKLVGEVVKVRRAAKSPSEVMREDLASLIINKGMSQRLLDELPTRWERLGDIVVLPGTCFKDTLWNSIEADLWPTVAKSLGARRLARQGRVAPTGTRDSTLEILVGDNGWVDHCENGIVYSFDATKCMFSWGNLSEKLRMAHLDCRDEIIVDLFAGIGYFVLPFLVKAKAKLVYACEWNLFAIEALKYNVQANLVTDRCIILEGDNRTTAPKGVADRVCLGLIPTSEGSWVTAVRALRSEGGMLHVHGNVKDTEESMWTEHVSKSICDIARSEGQQWEVLVEHVERVKWYAPHIRHLVADVRCRQIQIL